MQSLVLVLGVLSSISLILSAITTDRKKMILVGMVTALLCAAQYVINHTTVALILCFIGIIRSLLLLGAMKRPALNSLPIIGASAVIYTVAFAFTANWSDFNLIQACPLIGAYIGIAAYFFHRMAVTKGFMIAGGLVALLFEFSSGFYTQMIGESFTLLANIFAFVMVVRAERLGASEAALQDIDAQVVGVLTGSIPIIKVQEALTGSLPVIQAHVHADTQPLPVIEPTTGAILKTA